MKTRLLSIPAFIFSVSSGLSAATVTELCVSDTTVHNLHEFEVVSNQVREEVLSTAPLFNLTDEQIKTQGITDISDALHRLPGVDIRDYGGAGGMKTVSVRGLGATHTGVIYDGIVLSDAQSGQIDLSRYSLNNLGGLSVLIGDNSDIFIPAKASASAATIILSSMSVPGPEDPKWHMRAQIGVGSFGMINPYINVGKSLSKKFSFSIIGDFIHAKNDYPFTLKNGKYKTREKRTNSMMNSGHGEINARWRITPASTIDAKIYYYDNDRELPGPVVIYNLSNNETLRNRNFFGQLYYKNLSLSKLSFQALAKFNWDASIYTDVNNKYPGGALHDNYYQREVYVSGSAMYLANDHLAFNYSADYFYNNLSSNQPNYVRPWRNSILQTLTGKYSIDRLLVMARILFSIYDNGVHSGESAEDHTKVSPSLSISFQPFGNRLLFVRASYKNIFRMPTFNDSYYFHMGSTTLRPETTDQVNVGVTWQRGGTGWLNQVVLTADAYYNHVKDKIVAVPQNMYIWNMTNLEKVRAFGADLTANIDFKLASMHNIVLAANYSFQRVQPRTSKSSPEYNKQVAFIPKHSGAASVCWKNPWVDFVIHATGSSNRYGTSTNNPVSRIDGYIECGISLIRTFPIRNHSIDLRLDISNILNTQYEIVPKYPMPGTAWKLIVSYNI